MPITIIIIFWLIRNIINIFWFIRSIVIIFWFLRSIIIIFWFIRSILGSINYHYLLVHQECYHYFMFHEEYYHYFWFIKSINYNCLVHQGYCLFFLSFLFCFVCSSGILIIIIFLFIESINYHYFLVHQQSEVNASFVPIDWSTCGKTKGCLLYPRHCFGPDCYAAVTFTKVKEGYTFEMVAEGEGYVSVGFSHDTKMVNKTGLNWWSELVPGERERERESVCVCVCVCV